jgi:hypothetical protein
MSTRNSTVDGQTKKMFDGVCILIALYLFSKCRERFKSIAFLVLCFFVVPDVVYHYFLLDFRAENNWVIYQLYNIINVALIYKLYKSNAHLIIIALLAINVLLNIVASHYFISDLIPKIVYNSYSYIAGGIMLACLGYMRVLTNGNRTLERFNNHSGLIGVLFRTSDRLVF